MAEGPVSTSTEIPWGRVAAVAYGVVVAYGLARGTVRVVGIAVDEVMYRAGGAGSWKLPGSRS